LPFEVVFVTPDPGAALNPDGRAGLFSLVRAALEGGVQAIQLRAKSLPAGELLAVARRLRAECDRAGAAFFINDRLDVALCSGADGVQLGETGLPVPDAVSLLRRLGAGARGGRRPLVGASAHSPEGVRDKLAAGADFALFGNVFPTASKPGAEGRGLDGLARAVEAAAGGPVVAIGGITAGNAGPVRRAGAAGIAVIGAIARAADPQAAARNLVLGWEQGGGEGCG